MTKEEWRRREEQWERFHAWETGREPMSLSPQERLAEVGALADLVFARQGVVKESIQDLMAAAQGIALMRKCLASLGKTA